MAKIVFLFSCFCAGALMATLALNGCGPDYTVDKGEDHMAGVICGTMYFVDYRATEADFQTLLDQTKGCEDKVGTETSYRNKDGSLKHAVVIGGEDSNIPGTKYDSCIINWELTPETALRAFRDVCLNRQF